MVTDEGRVGQAATKWLRDMCERADRSAKFRRMALHNTGIEKMPRRGQDGLKMHGSSI